MDTENEILVLRLLKHRAVRTLLNLVHDLAPAAIGRNKLQDTLMLRVALDFAGQHDVVIINDGVNIRAA